MMRKRGVAWMLAAVCAAGGVRAEDAAAAAAAPRAKPNLPAKDKFKLVLLAGQSNMAGRGAVAAGDRIPHPRVFMLNAAGDWVPAVDPVHYDKKAAGVGPGRTFGILLAESDPDIAVGLIPTACGGAPIDAWRPGFKFDQTNSHPLDDLLARTRRAQRDGTLVAILWHQGEADSGADRAPRYEARLTRLIALLREALDAPTVPFVVGQLPQAPARPWNEHKKQVDAAHRAVAARPHAAFVSSDGLTLNRDDIHLDAESQRIFGRRYFEAWKAAARAEP